jgi:hypothetical protein
MIMVAPLLWRQREYVGVDLPALEPHTPSKLGYDKASNNTKKLFWTTDDEHLRQLTYWKRPKEIKKVMGMVFFGRRHSVSILDCYLKVWPFTTPGNSAKHDADGYSEILSRTGACSTV